MKASSKLLFLILSFNLIVFRISCKSITLKNVPVVTNYGDWGPWEYCPKGQFANAFSAKIQPAQGDLKDDSGLNVVCLLCSPLGEDYDEDSSKKICSTQGHLGDFSDPLECPINKLLVGFNLMTEVMRQEGDDTAADNIRMYCSGRTTILETTGPHFGEYGREQFCLQGQAICGIRTQVEKPQSGPMKDDTTLNNVEMKCCDIPAPSTTCEPEDAWHRVIGCNNLGSDVPSICSVEQKIGTSRTKTNKLSTSQQNMINTAQSAGVSVGVEFAGFGLKASLSASKEKGKTTGLDWSKEKTSTFAQEVSTNVEFLVPANTRTSLYQIIGKCGFYTVKSSRFFRADTSSNSKEEIKPKLIPEGFFCDMASTSDEHSMIDIKNKTMMSDNDNFGCGAH